MNPMEARELAPISQFILKKLESLGIRWTEQGYLHRDMLITLKHRELTKIIEGVERE